MGRTKAPRATTIVLLTIASVSAIVGIGGYPLAKRALADRETSRNREVYATGLSPCKAPAVDVIDKIDHALRQVLPPNPDVSITAFPAFSPPHGIRIAGENVVYFRLRPQRDGSDMRASSQEDWIQIDAVSKAKIELPIARSIRDTLAHETAHAYVEPPLGLDGVTYYFRTANRGCATTWSSGTETRASMWTALFYALSEWAQPDARPHDEAEVRRWAKALKVD